MGRYRKRKANIGPRSGIAGSWSWWQLVSAIPAYNGVATLWYPITYITWASPRTMPIHSSAMSRKTQHTMPVIGELMRVVCGPLHTLRGIARSQIVLFAYNFCLQLICRTMYLSLRWHFSSTDIATSSPQDTLGGVYFPFVLMPAITFPTEKMLVVV